MRAELGGAGDEVLVIGDTTHDYEVARAMGAHCVLLNWGHHGPEKLSRCGVAVFDSLADVFSECR